MDTRLSNVEYYVIDSWKTHFAQTERKLVIYGIGKYTELILAHFASEHVVGLMDGIRTDGTIYGKPIISIDEAVALRINAIVIVAQANNIRIIYRRIADACVAHSIDVYSIGGDIISDMKKTFEKYEKINAPILKDKIGRADIVSFDVFDTLIMRRTLYPRDIFALVQQRIGAEFCERRIKAENELYSEGKNPNIFDIYERMKQTPLFASISPDAEIALEAQYLIRRDTMVEILQYARKAGKTVYCVSDMYLPGHIIKGFLDGLDIPVEAENILVSCDQGVSKSNGLFGVLRSLAGAKKILHIGDNYQADIESARQCGIEDTFFIEKASVMLEDSYASDILKYEHSLPNRLIIGNFISRQLNDPFLFSQTLGKFLVNGHYEMGYSFIAPLVYCFFALLVKKSRELQLDLVLLSSRDAFIIERVYQIFKDRGIPLPPMVYFFSSRTATLLASVIRDEDILCVTKIRYEGSIEDMLKRRFSLSQDEILPRGNFTDLDDEEYVMLHRDAIMRRAQTSRRNYQIYISKLRIPGRSKVGLVDFVSSGTCLKALNKFSGLDLTGLFFATYEKASTECADNEKIISMFGANNLVDTTYNSISNYLFLETIFTSYEATLSGFDDEGRPVFITEGRTARQIETLREMHAAIIDYVNNSKIRLSDLSEADKQVPDFLLKLLQPQYSRINSDYFDSTELVDEFLNVTYNLSDTIK